MPNKKVKDQKTTRKENIFIASGVFLIFIILVIIALAAAIDDRNQNNTQEPEVEQNRAEAPKIEELNITPGDRKPTSQGNLESKAQDSMIE